MYRFRHPGILTCAIYTVVFVTVFIFCHKLIWCGDDIFYQFNYVTGDPIRSLGDVIQSQLQHYQEVNGRFFLHVLIQIVVSLGGHMVFALSNAAVTVLIIILMAKVSGADFSRPAIALTAAVLYLLLSNTYYTPSCQINYVWGSALTFGFLSIFFSKIKDGRSIYICALCAIYSIAAGNGNEAINLGIAGALFVYAVFNFRSITPVQWILLVCFWSGTALSCFAPSNFSKAGGMDLSWAYTFYILVTKTRMPYLLIIFVLYLIIRKHKTLKEVYADNSLYFNAIIISLLFNLYIGVYSNRQLFGIELFSAVIILKNLDGHRLGRVWLAIASGIVICLYILKYQQIRDFNRIYTQFTDGLAAGDRPIYVDYVKTHKFIEPTGPFTPIDDYQIRCAYSLSQGHYEPTPDVVVYPAELDSILVEPVRNQYVKLPCGLYVLLQDKANPADFVLKRSLNLIGISRPYNDYTVDFAPADNCNTSEYNVFISTLETPFINIDEVQIIQH